MVGMKVKKELVIRQMEPRDFVEVAELEKSVWTAAETPAVIQSSAEKYIETIQAGVRYLLAVEATSDEIYGVLILYDRHRNLEAGKYVLTFSVMVVPSARRMGIGTFLLDFLFDYAREEGYKKISMDALSTDLAAQKLYERAGFVLEGQQHREFLINGAWVDNLLYGYFID